MGAGGGGYYTLTPCRILDAKYVASAPKGRYA